LAIATPIAKRSPAWIAAAAGSINIVKPEIAGVCIVGVGAAVEVAVSAVRGDGVAVEADAFVAGGDGAEATVAVSVAGGGGVAVGAGVSVADGDRVTAGADTSVAEKGGVPLVTIEVTAGGIGVAMTTTEADGADGVCFTIVGDSWATSALVGEGADGTGDMVAAEAGSNVSPGVVSDPVRATRGVSVASEAGRRAIARQLADNKTGVRRINATPILNRLSVINP
jgi:hypothetical protein